MHAYQKFSYTLFFLIAISGEGNIGKKSELLLANEFSNEIYVGLQCRIRCNGLLYVLLLITISGEDIRGPTNGQLKRACDAIRGRLRLGLASTDGNDQSSFAQRLSKIARTCRLTAAHCVAGHIEN